MATRNRKAATAEDDDLLPPPTRGGKIVVPAKKVASKRKAPPPPPAKPVKKKAAPKPPPPAKKTTRKDQQRRQFTSNVDDAIDQMDGAHMPQPPDGDREMEMEGFPQGNRRTSELEAQLRARLANEPVFPFPPELDDELKPYWIELVNSFPKDHFQVSDTTLMKMYCQCAYDIERQSIMIKQEGEVVMGARAPIVNPRCKVRESNRATLLALTTKFRNQPASRVAADGFKSRRDKAHQAAQGAAAVADDEDGLLAGGPSEEELGHLDDDIPPTRH